MQNIDFQTTILSRFDMIFIVKDEHNEQRDRVRNYVSAIIQNAYVRVPRLDDSQARHEYSYEPS